MKRNSLFASLAATVAAGLSSVSSAADNATSAFAKAAPTLADLKELQYSEGRAKFRPRPQAQKDMARSRRRRRNKQADASRKRNWSPKARARSLVMRRELSVGTPMPLAVHYSITPNWLD